MEQPRKTTAADVFNENAQVYQDKYMDVSLYHDVLDAFCNNIQKQNAEVLEIACGPGNITRYLLSRRPDLRIFATDIAPNMITLAKANNPEAEFVLMDCRNISSIGKKYDAVMCGFVLPYLDAAETSKLFTDVAAMLQPGGVFYISTMEGEYSSSQLYTSPSGNQLYMHYYEGEELCSLLKKNGFRIIDIQRKIYNDAQNKSTIDVVILAGK